MSVSIFFKTLFKKPKIHPLYNIDTLRENDPRILQVFIFPYTNIFLPDIRY